MHQYYDTMHICTSSYIVRIVVYTYLLDEIFGKTDARFRNTVFTIGSLDLSKHLTN